MDIAQDTFEFAEIPHTVARKPGGYWCDVVDVDRIKRRVLLHDAHRGIRYWVSFKTLAKEWRMKGS